MTQLVGTKSCAYALVAMDLQAMRHVFRYQRILRSTPPLQRLSISCRAVTMHTGSSKTDAKEPFNQLGNLNSWLHRVWPTVRLHCGASSAHPTAAIRLCPPTSMPHCRSDPAYEANKSLRSCPQRSEIVHKAPACPLTCTTISTKAKSRFPDHGNKRARSGCTFAITSANF